MSVSSRALLSHVEIVNGDIWFLDGKTGAKIVTMVTTLRV